MRRILLSAVIGLGVAVPASIAAIGTSAPSAFASGSSVTCKVVSGTSTTSITFSKCTPKNASYKTASNTIANLTNGGPLIWSPSNKDTYSNTTYSSPGQGSCTTAGALEEDATGTVIKGSGTMKTTAKAYTKIGDVESLRLCVNPDVSISLVPGTKAYLQEQYTRQRDGRHARGSERAETVWALTRVTGVGPSRRVRSPRGPAPVAFWRRLPSSMDCSVPTHRGRRRAASGGAPLHGCEIGRPVVCRRVTFERIGSVSSMPFPLP